MLWSKKITTEIFIEGMHCKHCAAAVTEALKNVNGVASVDVDLAKKKATVTSKEALDGALLTNAVDEAGFKVIEIK